MAKVDGLPNVPLDAKLEDEALAKARCCPRCGAEARIVSNHHGRQAYCGPCRYDWPIGPAMIGSVPPMGIRGLHKTTMTEPDYTRAFEDEED